MTAFNLFKHDVKEGILKNIRILILPVLFWAVCSDFDSMLSNFDFKELPTFAEYVLYCFAGADPIKYTQFYRLPSLWMAIFLLSCYAVFDYMRRDLSALGQQVILCVGSRKDWWLSKCTWTLCATAVCYLLALLTIFVYCLSHGANLSMTCGGEVTQDIVSSGYFLPNDSIKLTLWQTVKYIFLLPLLVLAALNMLGMVLSLAFRSIASFIIIFIYVILSTYYMNPFVFVCFGMVKNASVFVKGGYDADFAVIECAIIILACVAIGSFIFQRYNILQNRGEE